MRKAVIEGLEVALAEPVKVPSVGQFVGRAQELAWCFAAWNMRVDGTTLCGDKVAPLHFRLEGPPGVGKNEIVYEMARRLKLPLYVIQGHEELTPEDLSLILVPDPSGSFRNAPLVLRASPLATAIYDGGLLFFDEINRVPERALSPLASVLDSRGSIYSALAGIHVTRGADTTIPFRFCCALNPAMSDAGRGVLPTYIEERTLPAIPVGYFTAAELMEVIDKNLTPSGEFLRAFEKWYKEQSREEIGARQAETLVRYGMTLMASQGGSEYDAISRAHSMVFRGESAGSESSADAHVAPGMNGDPDDEDE